MLGGPALVTDPASDAMVVREVLSGRLERFEVLIRRHNQRLFRAARSILREDAEAEDAVQQAYLSAYEHLGDFDGRASFGAWLTRITVNESLKRRRGQALSCPVPVDPDASVTATTTPEPEQTVSRARLRGLLERSVDSLPESYRLVFVLRDVQELSTREAALSLEISEEAVRVRLHRARRALRDAIEQEAEGILPDLFGFEGARCDRITRQVLDALVVGEPNVVR